MDVWGLYKLQNKVTDEFKERIYVFIVQWILYWGCIDYSPQLCTQMAKFVENAIPDFLGGLAVNQISTLMSSDLVFKSPPGEPVEMDSEENIKLRATSSSSTPRQRFSRAVALPLNMLSPRNPEDKIDILQFHSDVIANHLTAIECEIFKNIKMTEFLNNNWLKENKHTVAPSLTNLSEHFNKVVGWVASLVITANSTKEQVRVYNKFLRVARVRIETFNWLKIFIYFFITETCIDA